MVGVHVRVEDVHEREPELAHDLQIPVDLLEHRIDERGFARVVVREEIRERGAFVIEELAEEHVITPAPDSARRVPRLGTSE